MRTFLTILILTFFVTPVFAEEGEVDGKGLECTSIENPLKYEPIYYHFENGIVYRHYVSDRTPLEIETKRLSKYITTVDFIKWAEWSLRHKLDRKTLELTASTEFWDCQVISPLEIEVALDKRIEELEEEMKDNKI